MKWRFSGGEKGEDFKERWSLSCNMSFIELSRGSPWKRLHLHGNRKGTVSEKVVLEEGEGGWSLVRGSFKWQHEQNLSELTTQQEPY